MVMTDSDGNDFKAAASVMRLGRYELILRIGHGGVGQVYLARATGVGGFERLFAIKMIHPHLSNSPAFAKALMHEAQLASRIRHRNTVAVFDVGVHQDAHFLVMEYIEGCSLAELCRCNLDNRPPDRLGPIILDALYGLQAAHELCDEDGRPLKLIHRDFSPPNLLVGTDGTCRVTDFGIARTNTLVQHTNPGTIKGKPSYMAPEQVTGGEIDQRTDIFAAGVILWNSLTGKRLFDGPSEAATMYNVLRRQIPNPSEIGLKPDPAFDPIITKALQRRPEFRFQSAGEMAEAFRGALLKTGMLGSTSMVGDWVVATFGERLEARSKRIRALDAALASDGAESLAFHLQLGAKLGTGPSSAITGPGLHLTPSSGLDLGRISTSDITGRGLSTPTPTGDFRRSTHSGLVGFSAGHNPTTSVSNLMEVLPPDENQQQERWLSGPHPQSSRWWVPLALIALIFVGGVTFGVFRPSESTSTANVQLTEQSEVPETEGKALVDAKAAVKSKKNNTLTSPPIDSQTEPAFRPKARKKSEDLATQRRSDNNSAAQNRSDKADQRRSTNSATQRRRVEDSAGQQRRSGQQRSEDSIARRGIEDSTARSRSEGSTTRRRTDEDSTRRAEDSTGQGRSDDSPTEAKKRERDGGRAGDDRPESRKKADNLRKDRTKNAPRSVPDPSDPPQASELDDILEVVPNPYR